MIDSNLDRVISALMTCTESEVDSIMRMFGLGLTPAGWGSQTALIQRMHLRRMLSEASKSQLEELMREIEVAPHSDPEEAIDSAVSSDPMNSVRARGIVDPQGPIFVVHGHDHAVLHHAVRALEGATGREVVVLHEQANRGRTILEKFEAHAESAAFAVVLLTGDDRGGAKGAEGTSPRGRQNVIFELGFFFGKLGRSRVVVLLDQGVEKPSDIDGLVYISIDSAGAWKASLARELQAAGMQVDYSKMP